MKRALCLLLVLALAVPLTPTPAHAGCCDDFWGCVGAVVTGGLSCAVQEAIDAINGFVKMVRDVRDKGKAELEAAFAQHKEAAQQAAQEARDQMQQMVAAMEQAQKDAEKANQGVQMFKGAVALQGAGGALRPTVGAGSAAATAPKAPTVGSSAAKNAGTTAAQAAAAPGTSGTAPLAPNMGRVGDRGAAGLGVALALKPADEGRMKNAMKEAEKQVAAERDRMKNQRQQVMEQKAKQTEAEAASRVAALQQLLDVVFIAPLAGIIGFFAVGDPIVLAVSIAVMSSKLNAVKQDLDNKVDPAVMKAADDQQKLIDEMEKQAQDAQKDVDKSRKTVALMQKLEKTKLQSDLEALEAQLGIKHVALSPAAMQVSAASHVAFKSTALHVSSKERAVLATRTLKTDLDAPIAVAASFKKPTPPPVAGFRARVNTDLESRFRGRTGAELTRRRDDLIAEARVYFAKDPKTLEAVEKYLREQASARGAR